MRTLGFPIQFQLISVDNKESGGTVTVRQFLFIVLSFFPTLGFGTGTGTAPAAAAGASAQAIAPVSPLIMKIKDQVNMLNTTTIDTTEIKSAAEKLSVTGSSCDFKKTLADAACLENESIPISKYVSEFGDLINLGVMIGSSIGEQCKGISNALSKAGTALGLYQAACAGAQAICEGSCATVYTQLEVFRTQVTKLVSDANAMVANCPAIHPACESFHKDKNEISKFAGAVNPILPSAQTITSDKRVVCGQYKISAKTAMLGAVSALKGFAQSKNCEDKNSNGDVASMDCSNTKSLSYSSPNCMCARGEKSPAECQNININTGNLKTAAIALPKNSQNSKDEKLGGGLGLDADSSSLGPQNAGLSGAPSPVDGGGGGLGGGGGTGGGAQDSAGNGKRLNTNILGGGFGGGGGGGSSGGGPGYGEMDAKLKDYMPGGKNDPNRSLASQMAKEVTPQAGRSNWEKIRLRYRDHYSSLLKK